ncbi:MAG TPA: TonB-dependent receptor, partial [Thermoanaerobaculia bacterium]|nr:TonB-dependent receptor [Thermoanaerobaculia bacterium]
MKNSQCHSDPAERRGRWAAERRSAAKNPVHIGAVLLGCLLLTTGALADDTRSDTPPKVKGEIVVTASAIPESVESTPAAVTIITKAQMQQQDARDVADVLREVPGIVMSRTGSEGRATSLFMRGADSTHTLVLWNGIEIDNPYFAGYDWGRFSTAGVEQVEVVRGPYSALYGSDAVAGVVNVLTSPTRSGVSGDAEIGNYGLRNANATASYVRGANMLNASVERRVDSGFAVNDDFAQNSANLLWRWTATDRLSVGVAGRFTRYQLGIPFDLNADASALVATPQRRQHGSERQIAIPLSQTLGAFSYDLTLSESSRSDDFHDPNDPFGLVDQATDSKARRARLSTKSSTSFGAIVAGAEYAHAVVNDVSTYGVNLANDQRTEKSLFAEDRISHAFGTSSLQISAGARYDEFDTFGSQISPRIAAAWVFGGNKIRAAYGEAFRAPSVGELYYPFSGNRNLRPERSRSFELGYDTGFGRSGMLSATLFRGRYRDLIVFDNATYAFANVGRARSQGIELGASGDLLPYLNGAVSYTYLDTNEAATDKALLRRPRNSGSATLTYRHVGVDTSFVLLHAGRRD